MVWVLVACALAAIAPAAAQTGTVYWVDDAGSDAVGCGASSTSPCKTIQYAIGSAYEGGEIRVLPGTYNECIYTPVQLSIVADAILQEPPSNRLTVIDGWSVCGGSYCSYDSDVRCLSNEDCAGTCVAGTCSNDAETSCEGDGDCEFSCNAFEMETYATVDLENGSSLRGFTVTGGGNSGIYAENGSTIEENYITGNRGMLGGGIAAALVAEGSEESPVEGSLVIRGNTVANNFAAFFGGGILALSYADYGYAHLVAEENTVTGNYALAGSGGGIFVQAYADSSALVEAEIRGNTVSENVAVYDSEVGDVSGSGGGIGVMSLVDDLYGESTIAITENTIEGNTAEYAGGGVRAESGTFFYYGGYFYTTYGDDNVVVAGNTIAGNAAYDGGGVSGFMGVGGYYYVQGAQDLIVAGNDIWENEAERSGGGVDLFLQNEGGWYYEGGVAAWDNVIAENSAGAGGGLSGWNYVSSYGYGWNYPIDVSGNTIRGNSSTGFGGGVFLFADAGYDTTSYVELQHNLISSNTAHDAEEQDAVGGGALLLAGSWDWDSYSYSYIYEQNNTVVGNEADRGAGGYEVETMLEYEGGGYAEIDMESSIIAGNTGYGIGGPPPGAPGAMTSGGGDNFRVYLYYSNVSENSSGAIERTLEGVLYAEGMSEEPALLDADGVPDVCSPTINAGAWWNEYYLEPEPNGNIVNQGHLGNTEDAVTSLPDVTGDRRVNHSDVADIATAFGAFPADLRWWSAADLDADDDIDGDDLAYVASKWGTDCR